MVRSLPVAFSIALSGLSVLAQAPATVPLVGSVRDVYTRDYYLSGATVTVVSHRTGQTLTVVTAADGSFLVPALEPGRYTIAIFKQGYGALVATSFCLAREGRARFDVALGADHLGRGAPVIPPPDRSAAPGPPLASSVDVMTASEISEAIAFGRQSGQLKPYGLVEVRGLVRRSAGGLFTPFRRVASMAQVAAEAKQTFAEEKIPVPLIQRLAWIVGGPVEHYRNDGGEGSRYLAHVTTIVIRPKSTAASTVIAPIWSMMLETDCDLRPFESVFGRQFTFPTMLAAFPVDAIRAGNTILFTYSSTASSREHRTMAVKPDVRRVVIDEAGVQGWR
jgi:Carboxypeptidase regulatory-like domain